MRLIRSRNNLDDGLVAFWKFNESAAPYLSQVGAHSLAVERGSVSAATSGPFGGGVNLATTSNLYIPNASIGTLNRGGSGGVTVIAYVSKSAVNANTHCIAGRWDETASARQYGLFITSGFDSSGNGVSRTLGHVSNTGGATAGGWNFSVDCSLQARKTTVLDRMTMVAFTFDGAQAISYTDGVADHFDDVNVTQASPVMSMTTDRNPYPYALALNTGSTSPFRVNAANGAGLNSRDCTVGGVRVYNRALSADEIMAVYLADIPSGWPILLQDCFAGVSTSSLTLDTGGWKAYTTGTATDTSDTVANGGWSWNSPASLAGAQGYLTIANGANNATPAAAIYNMMGGGVPMENIAKLSVRVNHAAANTASRLLIEVDGATTHLVETVLTSQVGASNIAWGSSTQQDITFSRTAAGWRDLTINPGVGWTLAGAARSTPLPGSKITGIGAYVDSRSNGCRFTDFGIWKT